MSARCTPYENSPPLRQNIVTVAMSGLTATRAQISRYTGTDGLVVLRNWVNSERYTSRREPELIANRNDQRGCWQIIKQAFCYSPLVDDEVVPPQPPPAANAVSVLSPPPLSLCLMSTDTCGDHGPFSYVTYGVEPPEVPPSLVPTAAGNYVRPCLDAGPTPPACPDPPELYRCYCILAPRLLHNVMPSPEVDEMVHATFCWCCCCDTLNPIHWALVVKEWVTCAMFRIHPFMCCYSELGRTNLGGNRDQAAFTREVGRAVGYLRAVEGCAEAELPRDDGDRASGDGNQSRYDCYRDNAATDGPANSLTYSPLRRCPRRPHLVLFGVSRGATACFYAAMKLDRDLAQYVSLVIVEAPFDTLVHVTDASCCFPRFMRWFFRSFCDYRGEEDERRAYSFDPTRVQLRCPFAFILSAKDTRVPNECSQVLIHTLQSRLVPHVIPAVEVLVLRHSMHASMPVGNKEDQDAYVRFMEHLYDTYCP